MLRARCFTVKERAARAASPFRARAASLAVQVGQFLRVLAAVRAADVALAVDNETGVHASPEMFYTQDYFR